MARARRKRPVSQRWIFCEVHCDVWRCDSFLCVFLAQQCTSKSAKSGQTGRASVKDLLASRGPGKASRSSLRASNPSPSPAPAPSASASTSASTYTISAPKKRAARRLLSQAQNAAARRARAAPHRRDSPLSNISLRRARTAFYSCETAHEASKRDRRPADLGVRATSASPSLPS